MPSAYHEGELAVQTRAGVRDRAARLDTFVRRPAMPPSGQEFLLDQRYAFLAGLDEAERPWASPIVGPLGFLAPRDGRTIHVRARLAPGDPLAGGLVSGREVGLLAIDLASRRRMKVKGIVEDVADDGIVIHTRRVYALCPKYIQRRDLHDAQMSEREVERVEGGSKLTRGQLTWIEAADTFVVATGHPETGADASHRGGNPGFVVPLDASTLVWPDYVGNNMFNTLGNIAASGRSGLLFIDFSRGSTLQLTGRATILWDGDLVASLPGAQRAVRFALDQAIESRGVLPGEWHFLDYSPFNPEGAPRQP